MKNKRYDFLKMFNIKKFHNSYVKNVARENGVGVGCLVFLKALTSKEFRSQQELSEFIGCNKAHTSRILTKMQEKGFIEISQNKNSDAGINLTEKGMAFAKRIEKVDEQYTAKLIENISKDDLEVFKKVCTQIYKNSEALSNK